VTLPDSQQNTRRSNSYNMPQRQMHNESDIQNDDRHQGRHRRPSVETTR
ncbi:unnamed protein product, partial [Rotaria magnacalcarata]